MNELADRLHSITISTRAKLLTFSEESAGERRGGWSKKEILGHLVDSACNNHQRFVRLQLADDLSLPGYAQDEWVEVQQYAGTGWQELVSFWSCYNLHLAWVIRHTRADKLANRGSVGGGEPVTLQYLMEDYLVHLEHHLQEIFT